MTKDVRREEMSKVAALYGCNVNDEICFVGIEPTFIVCHPDTDISLRQSSSCLKERSVSA